MWMTVALTGCWHYVPPIPWVCAGSGGRSEWRSRRVVLRIAYAVTLVAVFIHIAVASRTKRRDDRTYRHALREVKRKGRHEAPTRRFFPTVGNPSAGLKYMITLGLPLSSAGQTGQRYALRGDNNVGGLGGRAIRSGCGEHLEAPPPIRPLLWSGRVRRRLRQLS